MFSDIVESAVVYSDVFDLYDIEMRGEKRNERAGEKVWEKDRGEIVSDF